MSDGSDWLGEVMDCFRTIDEFIPGTSSAVAALLIGKMAKADAYLLGLFEEAWGAAERRMRAYAEQEVPYAVDAIREFWTDEIADEFLTRVWAPYVRECQDAADGFAAMRVAVGGFRLEVLTLALTVAVSLVWLAVGLIMAISSSIISGGLSDLSVAGLWAVAKHTMQRAAGEAMEHIVALGTNLVHLEFRKVFADVAARALADRVAREASRHVAPREIVAGLKAGLDPVAAKAVTRGASQLQKELKDRLFRQFSEQFAGKGARRVGAGGVERLVGGGLGGDFEREALDRLVQRAADTTMGRELVRYFGAKAAMGAGFMGGRTLFVQGIEELAGARGSIDWGEVASASAEGLVMGGLMGGRGFVGHVVTGAVSGASASALGDGIRLAQAGLAGGVSGLESAWAGTNLRADVLTGALGGAAFGALLGGHGDRFQENVAVVAGERIGQETRLLFDGRENGFGTVLRVEAPDVRIVSSDVRGTFAEHGDTAVWLDTDGKVLMREETPAPAGEGAADFTGSGGGAAAAPLALLAGGAGGGSGSAGSGSDGGGPGADVSRSDGGGSGPARSSRSGGAGRGGAARDGELPDSGPSTPPRAVPANVPVSENAVQRPEEDVSAQVRGDLADADRVPPGGRGPDGGVDTVHDPAGVRGPAERSVVTEPPSDRPVALVPGSEPGGQDPAPSESPSVAGGDPALESAGTVPAVSSPTDSGMAETGDGHLDSGPPSAPHSDVDAPLSEQHRQDAMPGHPGEGDAIVHGGGGEGSAHGPGPLQVVSVTPNTAENDRLNAYANTGTGWTGADTAHRVLLPDGREVFIFSDTYIGPVNPDGSRPDTVPIINNCLVVRDGDRFTTLHGGTAEEPRALFEPEDPTHWYWLGAPLVVGDTLHVVLIEFVRLEQDEDHPDIIPIYWVKTDLASVPIDRLGDIRPGDIRPLPSGTDITWGSWLQPIGDHLYIYGVEDQAIRKFLHVARVRGHDPRAVEEWEYWTGSGWSTVEGDAVRVMEGVSNEHSVTPWRGRYLLVASDTTEPFSANIVGYVADAPTGPFTDKTLLYTAPQPGPFGSFGDPDVIIYNAHLVPYLSTADRLVIVHSVNVTVHEKNWANVNIYRPDNEIVDLVPARAPSRGGPSSHGGEAQPSDGGPPVTPLALLPGSEDGSGPAVPGSDGGGAGQRPHALPESPAGTAGDGHPDSLLPVSPDDVDASPSDQHGPAEPEASPGHSGDDGGTVHGGDHGTVRGPGSIQVVSATPDTVPTDASTAESSPDGGSGAGDAASNTPGAGDPERLPLGTIFLAFADGNRDRAVFSYNRQLYSWDRKTGAITKMTDHPHVVNNIAISADGERVLWFDDRTGGEQGRWRVQPFGSAPGADRLLNDDLDPQFTAGVVVGKDKVFVDLTSREKGFVVSGVGDDGVVEVHWPDQRPMDQSVVRALSADERFLALQDSSRYHDVERSQTVVMRLSDGTATVLDHGYGRQVLPIAFSPVPGDQRLLVQYDDARGRRSLLLFDAESGEETRLPIEVPGELAERWTVDRYDMLARWLPDGRAIAFAFDDLPYTKVYYLDLRTGVVTEIPTSKGTIDDLNVGSDGEIIVRWGSLNHYPRHLRAGDGQMPPPDLSRDGLLTHEMFYVPGPGGPVPNIFIRPPGKPSSGVYKTVFYFHGGPHENATRDMPLPPVLRGLVDQGCQVVVPCYRGSNGNGTAWYGGIWGRSGVAEVDDVAAVARYLQSPEGSEKYKVDTDYMASVGGSYGAYIGLQLATRYPGLIRVNVTMAAMADPRTLYDDPKVRPEFVKSFEKRYGGTPEGNPQGWTAGTPDPSRFHPDVRIFMTGNTEDPRSTSWQILAFLKKVRDAGKTASVQFLELGGGHNDNSQNAQQAKTASEAVEEFLRRELDLGERSPVPDAEQSNAAEQGNDAEQSNAADGPTAADSGVAERTAAEQPGPGESTH